MFRKYLKPSIYLAILIVPFFIVLFKPKSVHGVLVLDAASRPAGWVQDLAFEFKKLWYYRDTYAEYRKLKLQTDLLKSKVVRLQEAFKEDERLAQIDEFRRKESFATVISSVIGRDPSNWDASLILDKGEVQGIKIGMPVLSARGVVGKIIEVGRTTSKAVLLSDPNFSVAAIDARSRESGLLTGTLQGLCRFKYLTDTADLKVGDQVVTSKLSTSFPQGISIGQIVDVQASVNSHTVECLVEPIVDLSELEEVVILKNERD